MMMSHDLVVYRGTSAIVEEISNELLIMSHEGQTYNVNLPSGIGGGKDSKHKAGDTFLLAGLDNTNHFSTRSQIVNDVLFLYWSDYGIQPSDENYFIYLDGDIAKDLGYPVAHMNFFDRYFMLVDKHELTILMLSTHRHLFFL